MNTNATLPKNLVDLTTTSTLTDGYETVPTQSPNHEHLKTILSYGIPFSCLAIVVLVFVVIGIRQRHRVLDKWTSLKRMRNTNPKFLQSPGLRRDSEFDSYNRDHVNSTPISQENPLYKKEQQYHLRTIT
jgi:hypothetical protein